MPTMALGPCGNTHRAPWVHHITDSGSSTSSGSGSAAIGERWPCRTANEPAAEEERKERKERRRRCGAQAMPAVTHGVEHPHLRVHVC
jgi:hypothetical protein